MECCHNQVSVAILLIILPPISLHDLLLWFTCFREYVRHTQTIVFCLLWLMPSWLQWDMENVRTLSRREERTTLTDIWNFLHGQRMKSDMKKMCCNKCCAETVHSDRFGGVGEEPPAWDIRCWVEICVCIPSTAPKVFIRNDRDLVSWVQTFSKQLLFIFVA